MIDRLFKWRKIVRKTEEERDMRRLYDPVPVTLLTGFLGSGKTTLLNDILADPRMAGTAVIRKIGVPAQTQTIAADR